MHAKRKSASPRREPLQTAPPPHPRAASIRADDPPRRYSIPGGHDSFFKKPRHRRFPHQANPAISRALYHSLVQDLPPNSESMSARKTGVYRRTIILKPNAPKCAPIHFAQFDSELAERP